MPNQQVDVSNTSSREKPEPELGIPAATDVVQASPSPEKGAGSHSAKDAAQLDGVASSAAYFAPAVVQPRAGNIGFWRGSPAEIIFATLTAIAVILAVILSVVRIPGPASASTGSNTGAQSGSSSNASKPSITVPAHKTYDAAAPAAPQGSTVNIELVAQESLISIAPGAAYQAWTFNGTVPGPILRVRQGQTVNFTIVNKTGMDHSIDFHAAETPWNINYQAVGAGKSFSFSWKAMYPGIFMYHCGTPPVIQHIANGMYGAIIVDPASGWRPAQEYVLVQSEFYTRKVSDGSLSFDHAKAMAMQPDYVTFNGYANQYKDAPLTAHLGQRVRLFVLNAGPSEFSAFHTIGAMFTDVYMDGNPANHMVGNQTVTIPPGGGAVVELSIPEAGLYPFVTHSFANASAGALGVLEIKK